MALVSFALLLVFVLNAWADLRAQSQSAVSVSRLESVANSIADALAQSPGTPCNWEANSPSMLALGLASSPGVLSQAKLSSLSAMNYGSAKAALGVDKNFYVVVSNNGWSALYALGNASARYNMSMAATRLATLNGQPVRIRVVVYE